MVLLLAPRHYAARRGVASLAATGGCSAPSTAAGAAGTSPAMWEKLRSAGTLLLSLALAGLGVAVLLVGAPEARLLGLGCIGFFGGGALALAEPLLPRRRFPAEAEAVLLSPQPLRMGLTATAAGIVAVAGGALASAGAGWIGILGAGFFGLCALFAAAWIFFGPRYRIDAAGVERVGRWRVPWSALHGVEAYGTDAQPWLALRVDASEPTRRLSLGGCGVTGDEARELVERFWRRHRGW